MIFFLGCCFWPGTFSSATMFFEGSALNFAYTKNLQMKAGQKKEYDTITKTCNGLVQD